MPNLWRRQPGYRLKTQYFYKRTSDGQPVVDIAEEFFEEPAVPAGANIPEFMHYYREHRR